MTRHELKLEYQNIIQNFHDDCYSPLKFSKSKDKDWY